MTQAFTAAESKALDLLGRNFPPEVVANTVGLSASRISQLLSQEEFAKEVVERKYRALAAQTSRDTKADELEDLLLEKLKNSLSMVFDPMKIARLYQVVNAAKRRGIDSSEQMSGMNKSTVVQLNIPTQVFQQFTTNIHNQVIQAGSQQLLTIQSSKLASLLPSSPENQIIEAQNVQKSSPESVETSRSDSISTG